MRVRTIASPPTVTRRVRRSTSSGPTRTTASVAVDAGPLRDLGQHLLVIGVGFGNLESLRSLLRLLRHEVANRRQFYIGKARQRRIMIAIRHTARANQRYFDAAFHN